jgi:hypothetical protein
VSKGPEHYGHNTNRWNETFVLAGTKLSVRRNTPDVSPNKAETDAMRPVTEPELPVWPGVATNVHDVTSRS